MTLPLIAGGTRSPPRGAVNLALDRSERVKRWTAALLTVLLHGLFVLFLMSPPTPITMTEPPGQAGGSTMEATLIDESNSAPPAEPVPMQRMPVRPKRPKTPRAIAPTPPMPVVQSAIPMPPTLADSSDTPTLPPTTEPEPPDATRDTAERPVIPFGPQPGMVRNDNARANAALAAKLGRNRGRSNNAAPTGVNMGVDGFQVYYDLAEESRLREWRDQGITELFLPMPGTRRLMVCPLEVALRRGSGACRMIEMDSPELEFLGDALEVIDIQQVYHQGAKVWSGPGAYRWSGPGADQWEKDQRYRNRR